MFMGQFDYKKRFMSLESLKKKRKYSRSEKVCKEIMAGNLMNFSKDITLQIQEQSPCRINTKKCISRQIRVKLLKTKVKKRS